MSVSPHVVVVDLDQSTIMFMNGQNVLWFYSSDKLKMIKTLYFSKELSVAAWHFTHTIKFYVWEYARTIPILPAYLVFLLGHGQNNPPQKPQQRKAQLWKLGKMRTSEIDSMIAMLSSCVFLKMKHEHALWR